MELLNHQQRPRSTYGCAVFLFLVFLTGAFSLGTAGVLMQKEWGGFWVPVCTAALLFFCLSYIYGFIKNEVWRFGIRDGSSWWDSPRWPRSAGSVSLDDVRKVTIYEGLSRLEISKHDDTCQRIPCFCPKRVKDVLSEHYPCVAVEYIEAAD